MTIKDLRQHSGLSRSALLYYDSLGLLPGQRTKKGYRIYTQGTLRILDRILLYRQAGVPLADIRRFLRESDGSERALLEATLDILVKESRRLRSQQKIILEMLEGKDPPGSGEPERWKLFRDSLEFLSLNPEGIKAFHEYWEKTDPRHHRTILENFGFSQEEQARILNQSLNHPPKKYQRGELA